MQHVLIVVCSWVVRSHLSDCQSVILSHYHNIIVKAKIIVHALIFIYQYIVTDSHRLEHYAREKKIRQVHLCCSLQQLTTLS